MSAAATAAGYLYASGRLRGRGAKDEETTHEKPRKVKVAVYEPEVPAQPQKPKRVPKIEYRRRRIPHEHE
jgi:hypothetical protein